MQTKHSKLNLIPALIIFTLLFNIQQILFYVKGINGSPNEKGIVLKGFSKDSFLREQILSFGYSPDINVEINAPSADKFDETKKTLLNFGAGELIHSTFNHDFS